MPRPSALLLARLLLFACSSIPDASRDVVLGFGFIDFKKDDL